MTRSKILAGALAACAVALGGCQDQAAVDKANAELKAKNEAAAKAKLARGRIDMGMECLAGLKWQERTLKAAGIGDLAIYRDYFRERIATAVGDQTLPAEGARPALTKDTIDPYFEAAYPEIVKETYDVGTDANGDGAIRGSERARSAYTKVANCVQEVAEMGKGPLAGQDKKVDRMFKMQALRDRMEKAGI